MTSNCMSKMLSTEENSPLKENQAVKQKITPFCSKENRPENAKEPLEKQLIKLKIKMAYSKQLAQALITSINVVDEEVTLCQMLLKSDIKRKTGEPRLQGVRINWKLRGQRILKALMQVGQYQDLLEAKLDYPEAAKSLKDILDRVSPRNLRTYDNKREIKVRKITKS